MFTTGFLLFLQGIRESVGAPLNTFFMNCTDFGNLPIMLFLIAIIYWSLDKKLGEYLLVSLSFSRLANSFLKLTACVYSHGWQIPGFILMRVLWNRQQGIPFQVDTHILDNTVYRIHHPGKPHQGSAVPFHFLHGVDGVHPLLSGCALSH